MKPAVRDAIIGGLAKGWPRDKTPKLDADAEQAIADAPADALARGPRPDARARLALGRPGARAVRRRARPGLPRRGLRRVEARGGPHRRRPAVDRPPQGRPAGRARRPRPRHGEDAARPRERPDRRRGAERLARGRPGAGGRDRADDPGGPQGEHPGAARQDRLDERAGERDREGEGGDCPSSRSTRRRPWRPTPTARSPSGPRPCSPRGAACPTRIARRSSRRWRRSS